MRDLDALKSLLQEPPEPYGSSPLGKEELMALIQARTTDVKARTLRRVRKEIQTYLVVMMIPIVVLLLRHGISVPGLLGSFAVLVLMGLTIAALSYKEYQIRSLSLHETLREALTNLIAAVHSTTKVYMTAYMVSVVVPVAALEVLLIWRQGLTFLPLLGVAAGIVFVAWCHRAGCAYLERHFGAYRTELMKCLSELESG